ncbi:FAD-dependent oxidoreductase [Nonomuraea angiospora]|uniref:FAD-dependent oxidoreductase n=1 Tax=Nonomuraea angiospora TaxID=46172 RepID=UPI0029AE1C29|nr:NAD(P)/FAD-dependent oxidoreductase [Nonomuraea angiospora]MDX3106701.1 NAD(P)/FAD-dependent oxidoreductase [Nonomuraea angiospora]
MENSRTDVAVIGAGPAGLVLTEVLARRGMSVTIVEKQDDPTLSRQGALLQPVTLDLLHRLVAFEHSAEQEGAITTIEEYGPQGKIFSGPFADLADTPADHALNITQGMLRKLLLDRVRRHPSVAVRTGAAVQQMDSMRPGQCSIVVREVSGAETPHRIDSRWIVAADGKLSETRRLAGIKARIEGGDHQLSLVPVPTPEGYPRTIRVHRRPDGMATTVPGAAPGMTYVFTHLADRDAAPQTVVDWAMRTVSAQDDILTRALRSHADPGKIIRIPPQIVHTPTWRQDGVILLGDSSHGMYNVGGQGLNTSLQDALLVGEAIRSDDEAGGTERLDSFVRVRRPFIDEFQAAQRKLGSGFWPAGGGTSWFRDRFEELSLGQAELRKRWSEIVDELSVAGQGST